MNNLKLSALKEDAQHFQTQYNSYKKTTKFSAHSDMLLMTTVANLLVKLVNALPRDKQIDLYCINMIWRLERYKKCGEQKRSLIKLAELWSRDILKGVELKGESNND